MKPLSPQSICFELGTLAGKMELLLEELERRGEYLPSAFELPMNIPPRYRQPRWRHYFMSAK
jgi:hypothetical protein